jgi:hypothetical protein
VQKKVKQKRVQVLIVNSPIKRTDKLSMAQARTGHGAILITETILQRRENLFSAFSLLSETVSPL